jgi:hypothetical protein
MRDEHDYSQKGPSAQKTRGRKGFQRGESAPERKSRAPDHNQETHQ